MGTARNNKSEYFANDEHFNSLLSEIVSWVGTPFQYSTRGVATKGVEADCVSFPIGVFKNIGVIREDFSTPNYNSHSPGGAALDAIFSGIETCAENGLCFECVFEKGKTNAPFEWKRGDLLVYSSSHVVHHLLIFVENGVYYHCYPRVGVERTSGGFSHRRILLQKVYRLYEL